MLFGKKISQGGERGAGSTANLQRELTIGHTRGEMLSAMAASAEIPGALPLRLGRRTLQHVDDVHAVDALQSCVQALHCGQKSTETQDRGV